MRDDQSQSECIVISMVQQKARHTQMERERESKRVSGEDELTVS